MLSAAYAFGGEADLAIQQAQTAIRLSPRDFLNVIWHLTDAWAHLSAERFEESAECARRAIDWNPAFADAHGVLAAASAYLGRMADARASLLRIYPPHSRELGRPTSGSAIPPSGGPRAISCGAAKGRSVGEITCCDICQRRRERKWHVRFWHLTDIGLRGVNVCFRG
jgi:tetratricopeptide (TPR) repeat protein